MLYMHPKSYLWMVEQDRERAMAERALKRAFEADGEQRPGLVRGGMTRFARFLGRAGSATTDAPVVSALVTSRRTGSQGA